MKNIVIKETFKKSAMHNFCKDALCVFQIEISSISYLLNIAKNEKLPLIMLSTEIPLMGHKNLFFKLKRNARDLIMVLA